MLLKRGCFMYRRSINIVAVAGCMVEMWLLEDLCRHFLPYRDGIHMKNKKKKYVIATTQNCILNFMPFNLYRLNEERVKKININRFDSIRFAWVWFYSLSVALFERRNRNRKWKSNDARESMQIYASQHVNSVRW